jgi:hypothetical protein
MPTQVLPLAFFFWRLPSVFGCSPLAGGGYDLKIGYQKLYLQTNFQIDGVQVFRLPKHNQSWKTIGTVGE